MNKHSLPLAATLAGLLAIAGTVQGQGADATAERAPIVVAELGPQVGEPVPDFELLDQFGEVHDLESVMGPNGAMLLFHRSADW